MSICVGLHAANVQRRGGRKFVGVLERDTEDVRMLGFDFTSVFLAEMQSISCEINWSIRSEDKLGFGSKISLSQ